jgi:cytochrome c
VTRTHRARGIGELRRALPLVFLALVAVTARAEMPTGNAERGRQVFQPCRTCHYPEKGFGNYNGPSLTGIFGRKAGTREGFAFYSKALKDAGFVWTPELLNAWLASPGEFLADSSMIFVGIPDPQARADLIEYLKQF